jgi:glycerophosphoryl diester phosphodiesterase
MSERRAFRNHVRPADPVEVVAHAGGAAYNPANTRDAMEAAIAMGVDRLECDVQCAANGDLVLHHDPYVTGPAGERRSINALTTSELRRLVPGLLTLDDLAQIAAGHTPLLIDVKGPGYEDTLISTVRRHQLASTSSISTTYASTLYQLRRAFPTMRLGLSTGHWAASAPTAAGRAAARWFLRLATPIPLISTLHHLGLT